MKTYFFSDDEVFNVEIKATSYRAAIAQARDRFQIKGRIRLTAHIGNLKEWSLSVSGYKFDLIEI